MDAPQERRRYPRVKVKIPLELHLSTGSPQRTSIEEISLCGCYIETMFTLEVRTRGRLGHLAESGKSDGNRYRGESLSASWERNRLRDHGPPRSLEVK